MLYLTGSTATEHFNHDDPRIGLMMTPAKSRKSLYLPNCGLWAADPGTFGVDGPREWSRSAWYGYLALLRDLTRSLDRPACLFAAAPDVPFDAAGTLELSLPYLPRIRRQGYPVALVAQDGMTVQDIPWPETDALFIGGTTDWKIGPQARGLAEHAKSEGKHVHVGRVNTLNRLLLLDGWGCVDSVDGTFLAHNPGRLAELIGWLDLLEHA